MDTAILTKDGGSHAYDFQADFYVELYSLLKDDERSDRDLHADS